MMEKWTVEEALRKAFENWSTRQLVHQSLHGDHITVTLDLKFKVPAVYAKAILADVLREEMTREDMAAPDHLMCDFGIVVADDVIRFAKTKPCV